MPQIPETNLLSGFYLVKKTWSIMAFPFGTEEHPRSASDAKVELVNFLKSRKDRSKLTVKVFE